MKIVRNIEKLKDIMVDIKQKDYSIGFVPTMGCLHEGHLSLLQESIDHNQITICSIYVNPKQFNDKQDFSSYPRDEKTDIKFLKTINCDILFLPTDQEIYPNHDLHRNYNFTKCMSILEGEKRPGHFMGVITIVHKLFLLIQPDRAYFGEKDYQQLWIIKLFTQTFKFSIEIKTCPTIRDQNGLALSSRNNKLNRQEKKVAPNLFKELSTFKKRVQLQQEIKVLPKSLVSSLKKLAMDNIAKNKLIKLDYFEVIDDENFSFVSEIKTNKKYRVLLAAYIGNIRLIDNILID